MHTINYNVKKRAIELMNQLPGVNVPEPVESAYIPQRGDIVIPGNVVKVLGVLQVLIGVLWAWGLSELKDIKANQTHQSERIAVIDEKISRNASMEAQINANRAELAELRALVRQNFAEDEKTHAPN